MMDSVRIYLAFQVWTILNSLRLIQTQPTAVRNILFIISDDLRPELGVYKNYNDALYQGIQTPNIDALAQQSLVFTRAHCQMALCSPSRTSLLTARRIETTKVFDLETYWRNAGGNFTSMPQHFKENGYITYAAGKIYHPDPVIKDDNDFSWTQKNYRPNTTSFWHQNGTSWGIAEPEIYNETPLPDMQIRDFIMGKIEQVANQNDPFFIAAGFNRPHLPFIAPRHFFEMYPEGDIGLAANPYVPKNFPGIGWSFWGDLSEYEDIQQYDNSFNQTVPDDVARDLRRAYYAAVSYTDSLIGEVLDKLSSVGLEESTAVLFISDHGFQLGEHSDWAKHTNYELDTWVPMMLKVPGLTDQGKVTNALVEYIDIFPTLVDIVGLKPLEQCPEFSSDILVCSEGHSMIDLLTSDPTEWKSATFSQYFKRWNQIQQVGYVVRDYEHVYIRWMSFVNETIGWDEVFEEELYDLIGDPNQLENVAGYPEFSEIQIEMYEKLRAGWRGALPPEN